MHVHTIKKTIPCKNCNYMDDLILMSGDFTGDEKA